MRILFVLTSHDELGDTGRKTGYYLPEVTHPYYLLKEAGAEIDLVSIAGGKPPVDGANRDDAENARFLDDEKIQEALTSTPALSEVDPAGYDAVFFPGGHGTMWDFPDNPEVDRVARAVWESGGVVAAVCHGPAALTHVKLSDGSYLVAGREVATFTDEEERTVQLENVVPFLLQSRLEERGAKVRMAPNFEANVVTDGRLVTGQNPASAKELALQMLAALNARSQAVGA